MSQTLIRRAIRPEIRVLDEAAGTVEYVASDETVDSFNEVILAKGWRFDQFAKNAPFVDSHSTFSIQDILGRVIDFKVAKGRLIETVKWAIDVAENTLARLGFAMTKAGYAKAVSVGFVPVKVVAKWDKDLAAYREQVEKLGLEEVNGPRAIYVEQQQKELSAVVIGANPNALARAFKANVISDADIDFISDRQAKQEIADGPEDPDSGRQHHSQAARLAVITRLLAAKM